jgi:hypothetical protein
MTQGREIVRLKEITFVFPSNDQVEREWNRTFGALLMDIQSSHELIFHPTPQRTLPITAFRTANVSFPKIVLNTATPIEVTIGRLSILNEVDSTEWGRLLDTEVMDIEGETSTYPKTLSIMALYSRLKGHLVDIDHTGVNIPISLFEKPKWETFMQSLSQITNLYRYPDEEWPFIIPANEEEFQHDITEFTAIRTPKFEWVYDGYSSLPIFQFALVTDLSRQDLEEAFPAPYGFSIRGLEHIFRSVTIDSPWREGLVIRVDLYYGRNQGDPTDWETGEWLIKEGGRIHS